MNKKALVIIDIQNDITKNYKDIIENVNKSIEWALSMNMVIVYIKHNNLSEGTRTFKPNSHGAEFVSDLKIVSDNIFTKSKGNALTSADFATFIAKQKIQEFFIVGADAVACVKSTSYNMVKEGYKVHVLSDCVTSYDKKKLDEMFEYYASKGCIVQKLCDVL